jgi:hypothetical protein
MVMSHPSFDTSFLVDLIEVLAHRLVQRRMVILDRQDSGRVMRKTRLMVSWDGTPFLRLMNFLNHENRIVANNSMSSQPSAPHSTARTDRTRISWRSWALFRSTLGSSTTAMHSTKLSFAIIPWTTVRGRDQFPISFTASIFVGNPHAYASRLRP